MFMLLSFISMESQCWWMLAIMGVQNLRECYSWSTTLTSIFNPTLVNICAMIMSAYVYVLLVTLEKYLLLVVMCRFWVKLWHNNKFMIHSELADFLAFMLLYFIRMDGRRWFMLATMGIQKQRECCSWNAMLISVFGAMLVYLYVIWSCVIVVVDDYCIFVWMFHVKLVLFLLFFMSTGWPHSRILYTVFSRESRVWGSVLLIVLYCRWDRLMLCLFGLWL